jgi:nucleoid-associated protein YgaU
MRRVVLLCAVALGTIATSLPAQSLRGSRASIARMYRQANAHKLHFYQTPAGVERAAQRGRFVTLEPTEHFGLFGVSYPYAKPAVRTFVERLAEQYHEACGERLVVTSAIRPASEQPRNSTERSVHPTGMAVYLRKPTSRRCLTWHRNTLLSLERQGVLEATEERYPPHFHVAVYPTQYASYVERLTGKPIRLATSTETYVVRRGDTLWAIAKRHETTVRQLLELNDRSGSTIRVGEKLRVPSGG